MSRVAPVAVLGAGATCAQAEGGSDKSLYLAMAAGAALFGYGAYKSSSQMASVEERLGAMELKAAKEENCAFVFIKPHAVTDKVKTLVTKRLGEAGIKIVGEGDIDGAKIDSDMLIDTHYGAIAEKAVVLKPSQLSPSDKALEEFQKTFGMTWEKALADGNVYNARDGCAKLGIDGDQLDAKWSTLKRGKTLIKFGGGFYCGQVDGIFIINGFYMSMRGKFTAPSASIHYYLVEWPTKQLAWEDFRGKVLGGTNPQEAADGSLRKEIFDHWKALDLAEVPNTGDNGVHASASPFEALAERVNWTKAKLDMDSFGKGMLAEGIPAKTITEWSQDPQVKLPEGKKGSLFDALEDTDSDACLATALEIYNLNK